MSPSSFGLWVAQLLASGFFAVLFLQSGLDKVLDWPGNKGYIASVFAKTPLKRFSTPMLFGATVLEVGAGVVSAAGSLSLLLMKSSVLAFCGASLAGLALLSLFFGQRIAKDYAGAAGLVPYFMMAVLAVLLQSQGL